MKGGEKMDKKFERFVEAIRSTNLESQNDIKATAHTSSVSVRDWGKVEQLLEKDN